MAPWYEKLVAFVEYAVGRCDCASADQSRTGRAQPGTERPPNCPREDCIGRNVQGVLNRGRHPVEQPVERVVIVQRRHGYRGEPVEYRHEKQRPDDVYLARLHPRATRCQCGKTHRSGLKTDRIPSELRNVSFICSHSNCLPLNLTSIARVRAQPYLPPARAAARRCKQPGRRPGSRPGRGRRDPPGDSLPIRDRHPACVVPERERHVAINLNGYS
jgi:hypothetical protein